LVVVLFSENRAKWDKMFTTIQEFQLQDNGEWKLIDCYDFIYSPSVFKDWSITSNSEWYRWDWNALYDQFMEMGVKEKVSLKRCENKVKILTILI
jgi:hypothetical protein